MVTTRVMNCHAARPNWNCRRTSQFGTYSWPRGDGLSAQHERVREVANEIAHAAAGDKPCPGFDSFIQFKRKDQTMSRILRLVLPFMILALFVTGAPAQPSQPAPYRASLRIKAAEWCRTLLLRLLVRILFNRNRRQRDRTAVTRSSIYPRANTWSRRRL